MGRRNPIESPYEGDLWINDDGDFRRLGGFSARTPIVIKGLLRDGFVPAVILPLEFIETKVIPWIAASRKRAPCMVIDKIETYLPKVKP